MTICSLLQYFISEVISKIRQQDIELEVEDILVALRGVHIAWYAEKDTVTLTQRGLAQRIVEALQIENLLEKETPDFTAPLVAD